MPLHLVWLELIVHPVSALLFQGDPPPADLMRRPPRNPRAPMLPRKSVIRSSLSGALLTIAVFYLFASRARDNVDHARSMALAALILGYQLMVLVGSGPGRRMAYRDRATAVRLVVARAILSDPRAGRVPASLC
jgi:Ca2+-transporting ATPase